MSGFNYYGYSTKNILSVPLILGNSSSSDSTSVVGSNRSIQGSEISISRNYRNEYGVIRDLLSFTYSLIKSDHTAFTQSEQITIEKWLTYPKKSSLLEVFDCNEEVAFKYLGLFTNTTWLLPSTEGKYHICQFTFSVNGSYPYEHFTHNLINAGDNTLWEFNIESDYIDNDYIYPNLEITPHFGTYLPTDFRIININDDSKQMKFFIENSTGIKIDCKRCMITQLDSALPSLTFKNFGWEDVDAIYWLRLLPGLNQLRVNGEGALDIILDYDVPIKKVGGWLI